MEKYIKKSALIAELERRKKCIRMAFSMQGILQGHDRAYASAQYDAFDSLLSFIDTLETKDVQEPKDKERIREEIERLHEEYRGKKGDADVRRALRTVLFFIDSMQEEPKSTERKMNYGNKRRNT